MIRWTFYFDEGNVQSDTKDDLEDSRIRSFINEKQSSFMSVKNQEMEIYVNMNLVKCITRQEISEESNAESKTEALE